MSTIRSLDTCKGEIAVIKAFLPIEEARLKAISKVMVKGPTGNQFKDALYLESSMYVQSLMKSTDPDRVFKSVDEVYSWLYLLIGTGEQGIRVYVKMESMVPVQRSKEEDRVIRKFACVLFDMLSLIWCVDVSILGPSFKNVMDAAHPIGAHFCTEFKKISAEKGREFNGDIMKSMYSFFMVMEWMHRIHTLPKVLDTLNKKAVEELSKITTAMGPGKLSLFTGVFEQYTLYFLYVKVSVGKICWSNAMNALSYIFRNRSVSLKLGGYQTMSNFLKMFYIYVLKKDLNAFTKKKGVSNYVPKKKIKVADEGTIWPYEAEAEAEAEAESEAEVEAESEAEAEAEDDNDVEEDKQEVSSGWIQLPVGVFDGKITRVSNNLWLYEANPKDQDVPKEDSVISPLAIQDPDVMDDSSVDSVISPLSTDDDDGVEDRIFISPVSEEEEAKASPLFKMLELDEGKTERKRCLEEEDTISAPVVFRPLKKRILHEMKTGSKM